MTIQMKKLILIALLIFSSPSYAEWTKIGQLDGDTFYVDFERLRKHGGYVYFWSLTDLRKPYGPVWSAIRYQQGDCNLFRFKTLQFIFHSVPMGRGAGAPQEPGKEHQGWEYPPPYSAMEDILQQVCSR